MPHALYLVHIEIDPAAEPAWEAWMFGHHVPEVVKLGGFLRARRLRDEARAPDGWNRWTLLYEAADRAVIDGYLNGPHIARIRQEHTERFGATTRISRQILVEAGAPIHGEVVA
jgi:hypothetical protein